MHAGESAEEVVPVERLESIVGHSDWGSDESDPLLSTVSGERSELLSRLSNYVPAVVWISNYKATDLLPDLLAGVTVAGFQIPVAMSYATSLAHVPQIAGLYGLMIASLVYSLLGSVPSMVVGPEGALCVVIGQVMSVYKQHESDAHLTPQQLTGVITGASGAVLLTSGLLRFGFLNSVLSRALLRGFVAGVGVVMIIDQLPTQLGITDSVQNHPSPIQILYHSLHHLHHAHLWTTSIAITSLVLILMLRMAKRKLKRSYSWLTYLPEILLVILAATFTVGYWDLDQKGVRHIGSITNQEVPFELPFTRAKWHDFRHTFSAAFFCAILGFFESTIAARALASAGDFEVSPNSELCALGVTNLICSLFCTLPSFGGYGRSKLNLEVGARTQLSGLFLSLTAFLCAKLCMSIFYYLPNCALSTVITIIGFTLIEEAPRDILFYLQIKGWEELSTLSITFLATLLWSAETGIAAGVGFSLVRVIYHSTKSRIQILGRIPNTDTFMNIKTGSLSLERVPGCLVVLIPEPLTFANAEDLGTRLHRLYHYGQLSAAKPVSPMAHRPANILKQIVFDLHGMTKCDAGAAHILLELFDRYINEYDVHIYLCCIPEKQPLLKLFLRSGISALVEGQRHEQLYYTSISAALQEIDCSASRA